MGFGSLKLSVLFSMTYLSLSQGDDRQHLSAKCLANEIIVSTILHIDPQKGRRLAQSLTKGGKVTKGDTARFLTSHSF
jgi:hypothetical protein